MDIKFLVLGERGVGFSWTGGGGTNFIFTRVGIFLNFPPKKRPRTCTQFLGTNSRDSLLKITTKGLLAKSRRDDKRAQPKISHKWSQAVLRHSMSIFDDLWRFMTGLMPMEERDGNCQKCRNMSDNVARCRKLS